MLNLKGIEFSFTNLMGETSSGIMEYSCDLTLEEALREFDSYIGCVYPHDEESYYIDSNVPCDLSYVNCVDGGFYGDSEYCHKHMTSVRGWVVSQSENSIKYDKVNTKRVYIKLNKNTDSDILSYLDSKKNKQGYIKELIRKDMKPR